ncbi:MAG: sulfatase-like hydrolase/transferase, partial [Saprospiraceae bacterium]|nr:sulfatase-like hydrolase/transferase [Saprospiraceae bacterium]
MTRPSVLKKWWWPLAGLVLSCQPTVLHTETDPPPNILFLLPDQMRGQAMASMGNPDVQTPNLDRLAAEGILFRNTFANSPVCSPARANMLTGTYAHTNGMVANDLRLRE